MHAQVLEWVRGDLGEEPRWLVEPEPDQILAEISRVYPQHQDMKIDYLAQGGFNKVYRIHNDQIEFAMRISLPVDPRLKTESEVATLDFVRQQTTTPVPAVHAFRSRPDDVFNVEWILMDFCRGQPLRRRWRRLSMDAKMKLTRDLARHQAELFSRRFQGIGSLFSTSDIEHSPQPISMPLPSSKTVSNVPPGSTASSSTDSAFVVGRIVSREFFWGDRVHQNVFRGPFKNSFDWMASRLQVISEYYQRLLAKIVDLGEGEDYQIFVDRANELHRLLPKVFDKEELLEPTIISHDDLSQSNILVCDNDTLDSIIDWEFVGSVPLWKGCQFPYFLQGHTRDMEPDRENYGEDSSDEDEDNVEEYGHSSDLDKEGMSEVYWQHKLEFEQTSLRTEFLQEMQLLAPEWVEIHRRSTVKAEFDKAIERCEEPWGGRVFQLFTDSLEAGTFCTLDECEDRWMVS